MLVRSGANLLILAVVAEFVFDMYGVEVEISDGIGYIWLTEMGHLPKMIV